MWKHFKFDQEKIAIALCGAFGGLVGSLLVFNFEMTLGLTWFAIGGIFGYFYAVIDELLEETYNY